VSYKQIKRQFTASVVSSHKYPKWIFNFWFRNIRKSNKRICSQIKDLKKRLHL